MLSKIKGIFKNPLVLGITSVGLATFGAFTYYY